jgi:hypothetical protein
MSYKRPGCSFTSDFSHCVGLQTIRSRSVKDAYFKVEISYSLFSFV